MSMKTMVIGLGGFGCGLAETTEERFQYMAGEDISFIGIDTDETENGNLKTIILMKDAGVTVSRMLQECPEAKEWFPDSDCIMNKSMNFGYFPNRSIPRLAFEYAARKENGVLAPLQQEIRRICSREKTTSIRILIVSSLAGGTGTGLMIPVAQYVRSCFQDFTQPKVSVMGFFVLPKVVWACRGITDSAQKAQQGAFCYAALSELNQLMVYSDDRIPPPEWAPLSGNHYGRTNQQRLYDNIFLLDSSSDAETNSDYVNDSLFANLVSHNHTIVREDNVIAVMQTSDRAMKKGMRFYTAQTLRFACVSAENRELYLYWCMGEILQNVWISPEQSETFVSKPLMQIRSSDAWGRVCAFYDSERSRLTKIPEEKIKGFLNRLQERAKQGENSRRTENAGQADKWEEVLANLEERISTIGSPRITEESIVAKYEALEMIRDFLLDEHTGRMSHPVRALALLKAVSETIHGQLMQKPSRSDVAEMIGEANALLETGRRMTGIQRLIGRSGYLEKAKGKMSDLSHLANKMRIAACFEAFAEILPGLIFQYEAMFSAIPEIVRKCSLNAEHRQEKIRGELNTFRIDDISLEAMRDCYEEWMLEGNDLLDCGNLYEAIWEAIQCDSGKKMQFGSIHDNQNTGKAVFASGFVNLFETKGMEWLREKLAFYNPEYMQETSLWDAVAEDVWKPGSWLDRMIDRARQLRARDGWMYLTDDNNVFLSWLVHDETMNARVMEKLECLGGTKYNCDWYVTVAVHPAEAYFVKTAYNLTLDQISALQDTQEPYGSYYRDYLEYIHSHRFPGNLVSPHIDKRIGNEIVLSKICDSSYRRNDEEMPWEGNAESCDLSQTAEHGVFGSAAETEIGKKIGSNPKIEITEAGIFQVSEEPITVFSSRIGDRVCRIRVFHQDLTRNNEHYDVLACSAFRDCYTPVRRTLIGALKYNCGISVEDLAKHPALDMRSMGCWLSEKLDGPFERIACVELRSLGLLVRESDTRLHDDATAESLRTTFLTLRNLLEQANERGVKIRNLALPILGSGNQGIDVEYTAVPLFTQCMKMFYTISTMTDIDFYERDARKAMQLISILKKLQSSREIPSVFISYSSVQGKEAHLFSSQLVNKGVSTWIAPESIPAGSNYLSEISVALRQTKAVLLVLSEYAQKSPWVQLELSTAIGAQKKVFPVQIDQAPLKEEYSFLLACSQMLPVWQIDEAERYSYASDYVASHMGD